MSDSGSRRTPRQGRSRVTVDVLLDATAQVLVADGYDAASTNRIARRAGVSVGSIYQYFANKEALVQALAERHLERMLAIVVAHLASDGERSIRSLTARTVRGLIAARASEPALHRVLAEQAPVDVVRRMRRAAEQALAADMAARRRAGENRVDDPEVAAFVVVAAIDEAIRSAVLDRPDLLVDERLQVALVDLVTRFVLPFPGEAAPAGGGGGGRDGREG